MLQTTFLRDSPLIPTHSLAMCLYLIEVIEVTNSDVDDAMVAWMVFEQCQRWWTLL